MTTLSPTPTSFRPLSDEQLESFRERAAGYDRDNRFFAEDLDELRAAGHLTAAVPTDLGGGGVDLATLAAEQRRLARHAPATALSLGMHHYWVGTAASLRAVGDPGLEWLLREVVDGEIVASGHAESGNDVPVVLSTTAAERVDGGWRITGRKHFGSLGPVWTRLGFHAMDTSHPSDPRVVHGFLRRDDEGVTVVDTWDTVGMRATQSHDTVLDGVVVPDDRIARVLPAGDDTDPFLAFMNLWALTLIANAYLGIAERAFELAVGSATRRTSIGVPGGTMARNPFVQHQVAEMYLELDAARAVVDRLAADVVAGVDHGAEWGPKVLSAKWRAVTACSRIVERAADVIGGASVFRRSEIERLARDARCGAFHPGTDAFTHEMVGKAALGISPDLPRF